MSPKAVFRTASVAEAITWTLLIAAMIARYVAGAEVPFFFAIGLAHGVVFIAFVVVAVVVGLNQRWHPGVVVAAALTAIPPYGTVVIDVWLERSRRLSGRWRTEAGEDPRDRRWVDRTLRWFLRRPWLFVPILAAAIAAVVAVLLLVGPPGD